MESGGSGPSDVGASELSDPLEIACARGSRASWPDAVGWAERSVSKAPLPARDFLNGSIAYVTLSAQMKSSRGDPSNWKGTSYPPFIAQTSSQAPCCQR